MGFTDLFRPKYRHSNAAVRAEAVRQLGPEEFELVATIARDDRDAAVRRIAIDKLEDPAVLVEVARTESERVLRERAHTRAAALWVTRAVGAEELAEGRQALAGLAGIDDQRSIAELASRAELAEVREAALAKLDDPKALAELARNPNTPTATRKVAIGRISDADVLRSIAVDEKRKDVALAVLDRIDDEQTLEIVVAKAKNKAVRNRAKRILAERKPAERKPDEASLEEKRKHAERTQIVRRAETLARGNEWLKSPAEMDKLERSWAELGAEAAADAPDDLGSRFDKARDRYRKRHAVHAAAAEKRRAELVAQAAQQANDNASAQAAEEAGDVSSAQTDDGVTEGRTEKLAPAAVQTDDDAARAESEPAPTPSSDEAAAEAAERARQEAEKKQRQEERKQQQRERQQRDLESLRELAEKLERGLETSSRKQAEKLLQSADQSFGNLRLPEDSDGDRARFKDARQKLFIKVRELRETEDWQRWSNVPRLEALVTEAKALLTTEDESKLGERLRDLQGRWKKLGPAPRRKGQELWEEFKATCDQVYERVKGARARQAEQFAANLATKQEMCERVEALAESTDWDTTAEEIKRLQREWKEIGPVPRKQSDAVWKRFRAACDLFFERRTQAREAEKAERKRHREALRAEIQAVLA
ncbi:MAG: DUF349 domain-containing protein, partial [Myxococcota bacterium]